MRSTLFIPCFNEGTQKTPVILDARNNHEVERHMIWHTLSLLRQKIVSGIFDRVIIYDDWSTDDTLEWIVQFQRHLWINDSLFQIHAGTLNVGKTALFLDVLNRAHRLWDDIIVMTDADMYGVGDRTFDKLSWKDELFMRAEGVKETPMLVSYLGELKRDTPHYEISDQKTSGTRAVKVGAVLERMKQLGLEEGHLQDMWYGLEALLNRLFNQSIYVNKPRSDAVPLFSPPFRKWQQRQQQDIVRTSAKLRELFE